MAIQTKADLLESFADNSSGSIQAGDVRDFVDSTMAIYGQLYLDNPPVSLIAPTDPDIGVFDAFDVVEYSENLAADADQGIFTVQAGGDGVYAISINATFLSTGQNQTFNLALAKTGVIARPQTFTVKNNEEFSYSQFSLTELIIGDNFGAVWNVTAGTGSVDVLSAEMTAWRVGGTPLP